MPKYYICRKTNVIRAECDWVINNPAFEPCKEGEAEGLLVSKKAPTPKPKEKAKAKAKKKEAPATTASTDDDIDGLLDGVDD